MSSSYYIALDTHCSFSEMVVVSSTGRIVKRDRCATAIPELVEMLESVRKPRILTFEEGPLADWLARNLRPYVNRLIVCEPRRNSLIAKEGDKDDAIDAEKLAQLLRGDYLKEVHQTHSLDRTILKQHVGFYHARVRERVRQGHQLVALLRRHGVFTSIAKLHNPEQRKACWKQLPPRKILRTDLNHVWDVYTLLLKQEEEMRGDLVRLARREEPVRRFTEVPGLAWIRSVTFYAYIDTPFRFPSKSALWRYCGLGLERRHSGQGTTRVRLAKAAHCRLKNVLIGAALSAVSQEDNPLTEKYLYWTLEKGEPPCTARRNVARAIASLLWSMWKTNSRYDPERVYVGGRLKGSGKPSR